jgi:ribosomal protein L15
VHAHGFSKAAKERIEAAGGTTQLIVEAEAGGRQK